MRILIVDDLRDSADTLKELLEMWGHQAEVAYSGAAALEVAAQFRPELILCDLAMPGMDGLSACEKLQGFTELAGTRFVALTAYGDADWRERTRRAGFEEHLVKPAGVQELKRLLTEER